MLNSSTSNGLAQQTPATSRYRILCRRADGSVGLVRLCSRLGDACRLAKSAVDRHLAKLRTDRLSMLMDSRRAREVYIEQWVGTLVEGHWEVLDRSAGGYRFEFFDTPVRSGKCANHAFGNSQADAQGSLSADPASPIRDLRAGDIVECVLLEKRTRKNGWFAKLVGKHASGPVTGTAPVSTDLQAGQTVKLNLCGLKLESGFAQFAWTVQAKK
ncbi:MAG: hypothetical protein ABL921_20665 [Pirellula sp.]